jgi:hypothetical protein
MRAYRKIWEQDLPSPLPQVVVPIQLKKDGGTMMGNPWLYSFAKGVENQKVS